MVKQYEVLAFLRPNGGYVARGDEYEGIEFLECEPFTKEEYEAAFDSVETAQKKTETEAAAKRSAALAKLSALGLDVEDLQALGLGGN